MNKIADSRELLRKCVDIVESEMSEKRKKKRSKPAVSSSLSSSSGDDEYFSGFSIGEGPSCFGCGVDFMPTHGPPVDQIKELHKLGMRWHCPSCLKFPNKSIRPMEKFIKETKETLETLKTEIVDLKKIQKESGRKIQKEIEKTVKPMSWAEIAGSGEEKKVVSSFATCIANTQKKIVDDREARQNNVIIFNMVEEKGEDKSTLEKKFEHLCLELESGKKYDATVERIGRKKGQEVTDTDKDKKDLKGNIRPVKVKFGSSWDKRVFLSTLRNLKGKELFKEVRVVHDMSLEDRAENKRLLREAYDLNKKNTDFNFEYKVRGPPWAMEIKQIKKVQKN